MKQKDKGSYKNRKSKIQKLKNKIHPAYKCISSFPNKNVPTPTSIVTLHEYKLC